MTITQLLVSAWSWNPWVVATCTALIVIYGVRFGFQTRRQLGWLLAGVALLFLTMASPLDVLADGYLFSAHMLQHLLLLLIVPPLLLLSLPRTTDPLDMQRGGGRGVNWMMRHPVAPWLLGIGGMWLWHAPMLCDAAVSNVWIHRLQYVSLVAMGLAFWWPIAGPLQKQRLSPPGGIVYLFSACVGCTILGIIITFSPVEVCSIYLHPVDRLGVLPLLQGQWGLTPAKDQQLGGLLMWVPACLIYFCGILRLQVRWLAGNGQEVVTAASKVSKVLAGVPHVQ